MADNTRPSRKRGRDPLSDMANLPPSSRRRPGPRPANDGQENILLAQALFSRAPIPRITRPLPFSPVTRPRLSPSSSPVTRPRLSPSSSSVTRPRLSSSSSSPVTRPRLSPSSPVTRPRVSPSSPVTRPRPPQTINITRQSLRPRPLPKRRFFGDDAPVPTKRRNLRR